MTDDRVRSAFRTGLRPFVEGAPAGPAFDELTTLALGPERPGPKSGIGIFLAGIVGVVLVGVAAFAFLSERDTATFDAVSAAQVGEEFWDAVASGDFARASEVSHPKASLNYQSLAEISASRGAPLEIRVGREVFGQVESPQLCYLLDGPNGEARGSLVFRQNRSVWAVYEIRIGTATCAIASPTTTQPSPFEFESFMPQVRRRFPVADEVAIVVLTPSDQADDVARRIDGLIEVHSSERLAKGSLAGAASEWARIRQTGPIPGDWVAFGLVPLYDDSPIDEWMTQLSAVPRVHVAKFSLELSRTRIPPGWVEMAEIPFPYGNLDVSNVPTENGMVIITFDSESVFIGYDGSWRLGERVPEPHRRWMSEAYEAAVGDLVVYLTSVTLILDVETLAWSEIPRPAVGGVLGSAVIDGELYLVERGPEPTVVVFNPEEMSWRSLDPVPAFINVGDVTTDGTNLYVAGVRQGSRNEVIGDRNPVVFRYEPGVGWTELPGIPIDGQAPGIGWADGLGLIGWNYDREAALFREGSWELLPDHPAACESYPRAQTIPGGMYGFLCDPLIFDSSTMQWTLIGAPGWPTLLAPDGSALYGLARNRHTTLLLQYPLDR